jgi:hypothetical protein
MKVKDHRTGFYSMLRSNRGYLNIKVVANHHKSFVRQGLNYLIHSPYEVFSKDSAYHRTVVNHSLVVYLNPQKTILDEPLEDYEPSRFDVEFMTNGLLPKLAIVADEVAIYKTKNH